jgi:hypothetical protein
LLGMYQMFFYIASKPLDLNMEKNKIIFWPTAEDFALWPWYVTSRGLSLPYLGYAWSAYSLTTLKTEYADHAYFK